MLNKAPFATLKPDRIDKRQAVSIAGAFHLSPPGFNSLKVSERKMEENFAHAQRGQLFNMLGRSTGPGIKASARSPAITEDVAHVAAASPLPLRPG